MRHIIFGVEIQTVIWQALLRNVGFQQ